MAALAVGADVALRREPHNPEDSNAIAVHDVAGRRLGYLAHQVARLLAPVMDRPNSSTFNAKLVARPEPDPPGAAHRRWDPLLRYDRVVLIITSCTS